MRMALLLLIALLGGAAPIPAPLPVRVVLVGDFMPAEQAEALARTQRALDFWSARAPAPIPAEAQLGATLAAPADLGAWMASLGGHEAPTVYIVKAPPYPATPLRPWASYVLRYALMTYDFPLGAEATLAHELGHLIYNLRDTYPCGETDMMCNQKSAYPHRLGCATLAQLGGACWRVGLPMVGGRAYGR
jgi:hypothetical protein